MTRPFWAGTVSVLCVYVYFLIFAQFGFLHLLEEKTLLEGNLELIMAAMGVTGLVTSLLTAWALSKWKASLNRMVRFGFISASSMAFLAPFLSGTWQAVLISTGIGFSLGLLTVGLAAGLRTLLGNRLGLGVGLGTGLAYAISNISWLFEGNGNRVSLFCGVVPLVGFLATLSYTRSSGEAPLPIKTAKKGLITFGLIVAGFLSLVWLDSAAFYVIQQTPDLKSHIWEAPQHKTWIALSHLLAAIITGITLDAGQSAERLRYVVSGIAVSFISLATGYALIENPSWLANLAGPFYAIGVSIYSTLLVALPGMKLPSLNRVPMAWQAGILFAVAGWFGSANGIGMARELNRIPLLFFVFSAIGVGLLLSRVTFRNSWFIGYILTVAVLLQPAYPNELKTSLVERGRKVYISQGCIHCHSQFVRPETEDLQWFGSPSMPPEADHERPVLVGYRRQGPDLTHTGSRKPKAWQKGHLINPRKYSPGSVMPSYRHLFSSPNGDGDALLAYLNSLK